MAITQISGARVFSRLSADALPATDPVGGALIIGDLLVAEDGTKEQHSYGQAGWYRRPLTNGAAAVVLPQNASGAGSIKEIPIGTSAAVTTLYFPNGLNGVRVDFKRKNLSTTPAAGKCYIGFNNTLFNDVAVADLRHTQSIGDSESYTFGTDSTLPTVMTITTDAGEAAAGDSIIIVKGVQNP